MELGRWLIFLLINTAIFIAWFSLLNRRAHSVATRLLMAFILSIAQIIGSIYCLGIPWAKLTAANLVALNAGVSGALLVFIAARKEMLASLRDLGQAVRDVLKTIDSETVPKILALLTAATIIWIIFIAVIYPPIEWDGLMYHLPAVGHYMQQQSLADPPLPMGLVDERRVDPSHSINSFPKNMELLFLWTAIIPGNDTLVDLVELAFGLAGVIAVYALARRLGVDRNWSICAGLLFFLTPVVIAQSRSSYIDLGNSVLILAALALLYQKNGKRRLDEVVVAGIAAAIVVGAKWSGLIFLPILFFMLVGQRLYWNRLLRLPGLHRVPTESLLFLGPSAFFGAYWYVKNWILYHHNPLWPFTVSLLGKQVFGGLVTQEDVLKLTFPIQFKNLNMAQMLWWSWREIGISDYMNDIRPGGLGPFWFILGLPAIFYVSRWIIKNRDWAQASIFLAAGTMLLLHPTNWWTRFTLFIAGLGAICFAMVRASERRHEVTRLVDIMLIAILVYSTGVSFTINYYQPDKIAALLHRRPDLRTSAAVRPEIVSQAYDYIAKKTVDKPANIAFGSRLEFTYPLWGPRFRNRVYYLEPRDYPSWIRQLRAKKIKYLLIRTNTPEYDLVGNQALFTRTYVDREKGYAVYIFRG